MLTPQLTSDQSRGLVHWWPDPFTCRDYIGNNNGVRDSNAFGATGNQKNQFAFVTDGTVDEHINFGQISALSNVTDFAISMFAATGDITFNFQHFWGHDDFLVTGNNRVLVGTGGSGAGSPSGLIFVVEDGSTGVRITPASTIQADTLYHMMFVFDGSGATDADRAKIYVDGVDQSSSTVGTMATNTSTSMVDFTMFSSDRSPPTGECAADSTISDLRLYVNRTFNQREINDIRDEPWKLWADQVPTYGLAPVAGGASVPLYLYHQRHHNVAA